MELSGFVFIFLPLNRHGQHEHAPRIQVREVAKDIIKSSQGCMYGFLSHGSVFFLLIHEGSIEFNK